MLQFNRFDLQARSNDAGSMKSSGHGVTASLKACYPFQLNRGKTLRLEPQAQLIVSKLKLNDSHYDAFDVRFEDVDSLNGRIGVRIDKNSFREQHQGRTHRTNAWVRPSVWHEFKATTEFSSTEGYVPFGTDMDGNWGEMNLAVDQQLNNRTSVTGALGYSEIVRW